MIKDKRKFERTTEQSIPTNPTTNVDIDNKKFDPKRDTIKDSKSKK